MREALDTICRRYWNPAFKFLRSLGCRVDDAGDVTDGTFEDSFLLFASWTGGIDST